MKEERGMCKFPSNFLFININRFLRGKVCAKRVYSISSWSFQPHQQLLSPLFARKIYDHVPTRNGQAEPTGRVHVQAEDIFSFWPFWKLWSLLLFAYLRPSFVCLRVVVSKQNETSCNKHLIEVGLSKSS